MINWIGPINELGYGYSSKEIVKALSHKVNVSLFPIGEPTCDRSEQPLLEKLIENAKSYNADHVSIRMWHQFDLALHASRKKRIGFPIFELDNFTPQEYNQLKQCDELFVCSSWAKEVLKGKNINIPIHVIPLGVDQTIFSPKVSTRSSTVFMNIGKWEVRKGHDILIECFCKAFTQNDNVELWMLNFNPFYSRGENDEWARKYKESVLGNKVRIIPRQPNHQAVANLIKQADVGVFPSRAEGWNLELGEFIACGKYVIATNYSGQSDMLQKYTYLSSITPLSFAIKVDELESAYDGKWFFNQGNWAHIGEAQKEQLINHMRTLHIAKQHHGSLSFNSVFGFTWDNSANSILEALC